MSKHLQIEIDKLKKKIFELCTMVEESIHNAIKSIIKQDPDIAQKVINNDTAIDTMEIEVEEDCLKILALHQPVAIDLRFIVAALKINNDLERIGDLAVNIAERSLHLATISIDNKPEFNFTPMFDKSIKMIKQSLDSFINFNSKLAYTVCKSDDEIDDMHKEMYSVFKEQINKDIKNTDIMLQYLSISRNLERIADHATNIGEDVIYMIDGEIIRHKTKKIKE